MNQSEAWIVCQIGAREHYAIPRALHLNGQLARLITDFWVPPSSWLRSLPKARRLRDRYHLDIASSSTRAFNERMLVFETMQRVFRGTEWTRTIRRNRLFQSLAIDELQRFAGSKFARGHQICLFSYSYAAKELFHIAKQHGWTTVLGQIDPGPLEERIVQQEFDRVGAASTHWQPAPASYWSDWREETELADRILVNSAWSRQCLVETGVPESKLEIVPLVFTRPAGVPVPAARTPTAFTRERQMRVLFLGQVILRKGIARLLDAMRMLEEEPIELILAGPTDMDPGLWEDRPNVTYVGPVPRSGVAARYLESDVFILPTLSDGFAITQLESLAYGLPVIASRNCGDVVVHGKNGLLLDTLQPDSIATALRTFAQHPIVFANDSDTKFGLSDLSAALTRSISVIS
jgi:glycosyltransferase involved in cell wall biosynthesis